MHRLYKIILNTTRSFAVPGFNFLIALIAIKFLGESKWGEFVQISLWMYLIVFLANFGNKDYLLRAYSKNPSAINHHFLNNLLTRSIILLTSFLLLFYFPLNLALVGIVLCLLIFIYQSLESLVVYHQKFLAQLVVEVIGFGIIITPLFLIQDVTTFNLLIIYCIGFSIKIIVLVSNLKLEIITKNIRVSFHQLSQSFPFFLIGLSGWLSSKVDLYLVNIYLPKEELAKYQVLISAFLMVQSISASVVYPFSKHLYRMHDSSINKLKRILGLSAFPIISICCFTIWLIFEKILVFRFPNYIYLFLVDLFILYKKGCEKTVMSINFGAATFNLIFALFLIPMYGILGAVLSVLATQCLTLMTYKLKLLK